MYKAEDLMPKRYPENTPKENGEYICYIEKWVMPTMILPDECLVIRWDGTNWNQARQRVRWFIPIRLDEPLGNSEQLESEEKVSEHELHVITEMIDYLESEGYTVTRKEPESENTVKGPEYHCKKLNKLGYDVTLIKKEPEIKSCPFCGGTKNRKLCHVSKYGEDWWVICGKCRIKSFSMPTKEGAIKEWNALPRKE